jgi:hypothetical protein
MANFKKKEEREKSLSCRSVVHFPQPFSTNRASGTGVLADGTGLPLNHLWELTDRIQAVLGILQAVQKYRLYRSGKRAVPPIGQPVAATAISVVEGWRAAVGLGFALSSTTSVMDF